MTTEISEQARVVIRTYGAKLVEIGVVTMVAGFGHEGISPFCAGILAGLREAMIAELGEQRAYDLLQACADSVGDGLLGTANMEHG